MGLTVLLGGARSGKSDLAVRLARASGRPVVVVATATAGDAEMAERIARHRRERPAGWRTVEEPIDLGGALASAPQEACVIADCLSLWIANLLEAGWSPARAEREAERVARVAAARRAPTIAVSNEVGSGIVPASALARAYRDVLGRTNASWAGAAERSALVVAGRILPLGPPDPLIASLVPGGCA
jgi:adenosyl cobinamide kinase/adenosyl cobinamide phosphate guanylyltransferase